MKWEASWVAWMDGSIIFITLQLTMIYTIYNAVVDYTQEYFDKELDRLKKK